VTLSPAAQQQPFDSLYTGQPVLASTPLKNWRILLEQSYYPHALADGNLHIRIMEKTLEFSTVVLAVASP